MIDWDVAHKTATRLAGKGPQLSRAEADDAVAELRVAADRSEPLVRDFTALHAPPASGVDAPVLVVDRARWTEANIASFSVLLDPVVQQLSREKPPPALIKAIGSRVSGAEIGGVLAFMSGKVLGQFDPFWTGPQGEGGRLLLVAPNIVHVEQTLQVDPHDFRLWVCLHEETHRVQFTAVPWLRDHLRSLIGELMDATDLGSEAVQRFLTDGVGELVRIVRGESESSLSDLFQNEEQRAVVEQITAVMSLLEGHADVVMDGVGPEVIPSVKTIRKKFDQRRQGAGSLDRIIRRLLGLEGKMRQYRDGAAFVNGVVDRVGMEDFNAVWSGPETLPTKAELSDPSAWVDRVL